MNFFERMLGAGGPAYPSVQAAEADRMTGEAGALLIDVREPHEWRAGRAPQSRHIPLGELPRRISEIPSGTAVVVVCRSGARSARAAALLASRQIEVANLTGGMHAWERAGLPIVTAEGRPGRVA